MSRAATVLPTPKPPRNSIRQPAILAPLLTAGLLALLAGWLAPAPLPAAQLDRIDLDRYKQLRETERYQMDIAEQYYREKKWKVALAEYEKYLTLYERSVGAPYAQLKWSLCQVHLRHAHTAIKEGFQSVIDYWPDSPDAIAAAFYIGRTYKDMGELNQAKRAYRKLLDEHSGHLASAYALHDLVDISLIEEDLKARVALWRKLTFDVERNGEAKKLCEDASHALAAHYLSVAALPQAIEALATTYPDEKELIGPLVQRGASAIGSLAGQDDSRAQGEKLADLAVAYVRRQMPQSLSEPDQRQQARQYWLYVVQLENAARRYDRVPPLYQQIMKQFGTDDDLLGRLAAWHVSQQQWDQARATYARFEDKPQGQHQIALTYRQQQQVDPAVEIYRRLAVQDQQNEAHWTTQVAATYREARKFTEAIAVYDQLLKLDVQNAEQWRWLTATAYDEAGQLEEAIAHYRQSDRFPDNYIHMASCHRRMKQYKEALVLYNQVIGAAPDRASWAMLQVGHTHEQADNKEQAIKAFQRVCKNFPTTSHASQAHAHLQSQYNITITLGGGTQGSQ